MLGIGPGDEVITSAYTYTASASVIDHTGASIVLVDTEPGSYHLSLESVESAISPKTKAIIPVDIAGVMCDYRRLFKTLERKKICLFRLMLSKKKSEEWLYSQMLLILLEPNMKERLLEMLQTLQVFHFMR